VPHYSPTCGGMASSAVELTTVLANLVPGVASWRILCPNRSGFEGGGVVVGCPAVVLGPARGGCPRGPVRGIVTVMAMSYPRALQQRRGCHCSTRCGSTATGKAAPAGPTSRVAMCSHGKSIRGLRRPPFEGSACQPHKGRWHSVAGLIPASPHNVTQWRGWPSPGSQWNSTGA
jgi:hypothetical protein